MRVLAFIFSLFITPALAQTPPIIPNDGTTGTIQNRLAKDNGSGAAVVISATTDLPIGIVTANAGITGSATVINYGIAPCAFAGSTTAGHYVTFNSSAQCVDAGASPGSPNIGIVRTTGSGAGTRAVLLLPGVFTSITALNMLTANGAQSLRWAESGALGHNNIGPAPLPATFIDLTNTTTDQKHGHQGWLVTGATDGTVSGAVNNGSGLCRLTVGSTQFMHTGDGGIAENIGGATACNGTFTFTVVDATHVDLAGSTFSGTYTSGGVFFDYSSSAPHNANLIALEIYTPPDDGGDVSGLYIRQTGGGNAASFFNLGNQRPGGYTLYPNEGFAIEAQVDNNKTAIFANAASGLALKANSAASPVATFTDSADTGTEHLIHFFEPSLATSSYAELDIGAALSGYNAGSLFFGNLGGAGSHSNVIGIGIFGGSGNLQIDGNGNVGIGTTTPNARLDLGTPGANALFVYDNAGTASGFGITSNTLNMFSAGTTLSFGHAGLTSGSYTIDGVDIGGLWGFGGSTVTAAPKAPLHVGAAGISSTIPAAGAVGNATAIFGQNDPGYGTVIGTISNGNGYIQQQRVDGTATTYNLLLQPNGGNVGIGTASPLNLLHIAQDGTFVNGASGQVRISGTTVNDKVLVLGYDTTNEFGWLQAAHNGLAYEPLILNPGGGNVGIGTTTPGSTLQVNGGVAIGYSASTAAPTNGLLVNGNAQGAAFVPTGSTVPPDGMYRPAANAVGIATGSVNALYIDAGQHVGVGLGGGTTQVLSDSPFSVKVAADQNLSVQLTGGAVRVACGNDADNAYAKCQIDANPLNLNMNSNDPVNFGTGSVALTGITSCIAALGTDSGGVIGCGGAVTSWTPSLKFGGGNSGLTCSNCSGEYVQIGKFIVANFYIALSAIGTSTGAATITGLPTTSFSSTYSSCATGFASGMTSATGIFGFVANSDNKVSLEIPGASGVAAATNSNFGSSSVISGTCTILSS